MMVSLEFHHSCRYDYVEVRDGDSINSRVIGRFCGNNRPAPVRSSGANLHVLFVSDGYKNFDGFFATFQEISGKSNNAGMLPARVFAPDLRTRPFALGILCFDMPS